MTRFLQTDSDSSRAWSGSTSSAAIDSAHLNRATELGITHKQLVLIVAAAEGLLTKEIARALNLPTRTIEYQLNLASATLGAVNRRHLVALAVYRGLIAPTATAPVGALSADELETLRALSAGATAREIGAVLHLAPSAIFARIKAAKLKTGAKSPCELVALFASLQLDPVS